MTPPSDGQSQQQLLLNSIDSRLSNLDNKVDQIHIALVGSLDGKVLQQLRDLAGGPLVVTSGYRCPAHNARVGGAKLSQHIQGIAADIWSKTLTPTELAALAEQVPAFQNGGIGKYSRWIHVDVRNGKARW
jgi:zinc D-Ala-D-Ala carboxypeptidase